MPFFSIILNTFNQIDFLKKSTNSILSQNFSSWELIIIDNYSQDGSFEYAKDIKDKRVKVFQMNNEGMYVKSRNYGIKNATGDWLAFIDSDDLWFTDKLKKNYDIINSHDVDFIYHSVNYLKKNKIGNIIKEKSISFKKPVEKFFYKNGNFIALSSVVVSKKLIEKIKYFSEEKDRFGWEDLDAWIKLSLITDKFYHISKPLGALWLGGDNISNINLYKKNLNYIYKYYNNGCMQKFNFNISETWWFIYNQALYYFKKKQYKRVFVKTNLIPMFEYKFFVRILYFRYYSLYKILILILTKFFKLKK
jgi:glycosyltransferase involved in cell wall biosynthesis